MSDNSNDQLGSNEFNAVCRCGGHTKTHDVVFHYWPDPEHGDSFTITTGLSHFRSWYSRLWIGIKYVLGIDNTYDFYTESELSGEELNRLVEWMNTVQSKYKE